MGSDEPSPVKDAAQKHADMDSLCEGISRAIMEGLVEQEILDEAELTPEVDSTLAETGVIDSIGEELTSVSLETLLDSDEVSEKIMRIVHEKVQEVLNADFAQSRRGDAGIIAERVHLECARLFGRDSFRAELIRILHRDVEREITPRIKGELLVHLKTVMTELTGLLVERLADVIRHLQATRSVAAVAPALSAPPEPLSEPPAEDRVLPAGDAVRAAVELLGKHTPSEPPTELLPAFQGTEELEVPTELVNAFEERGEPDVSAYEEVGSIGLGLVQIPMGEPREPAPEPSREQAAEMPHELPAALSEKLAAPGGCGGNHRYRCGHGNEGATSPERTPTDAFERIRDRLLAEGLL